MITVAIRSTQAKMKTDVANEIKVAPTKCDEIGANFGSSFLGTGSRNKIAKLAGIFQFMF
jgi:hypothetical protein